MHRNRSLITVGVFHDPKLCGNPAAQNLRGLALIHTDSDTDLITMISDSLFQGWSVAFEPEYDRDDFLEYLVVSKPNFCLATTNFLLKAARQYLIEKRLGKRKMPWLLAMLAVGEGCTAGEERFINTWFREAHAGWGVNIVGPVRLPIVTVGLGGGDTEHGGIYYSLFHKMNETLKKRELKGKPYGMMPVPYAHCCVLRKNEDGEYEEAGYNENGIIVANSATTMARYKNDWEKTKALVITDKYGIDWVSCNVFGYIDDSGAIHMKDRVDSQVTLENGKTVFPYKIADEAQKDAENLLSTVVTTAEEDGKTYFIVNFQYSPLRKSHKHDIVRDLDKRMKKNFPDIHDHIRYRRFAERYPFPVTGAGKRSVVEVINMGMDYTFKLEKGQKVWTGKHDKVEDPSRKPPPHGGGLLLADLFFFQGFALCFGELLLAGAFCDVVRVDGGTENVEALVQVLGDEVQRHGADEDDIVVDAEVFRKEVAAKGGDGGEDQVEEEGLEHGLRNVVRGPVGELPVQGEVPEDGEDEGDEVCRPVGPVHRLVQKGEGQGLDDACAAGAEGVLDDTQSFLDFRAFALLDFDFFCHMWCPLSVMLLFRFLFV